MMNKVLSGREYQPTKIKKIMASNVSMEGEKV